ncbi:DUF2283 domain-containing protein [Nocardia jinanensis]|uniref:DUF2283 domain-containing protein n=1 Tax=Nocardia jinanensis TaxID=382504 RepID=A0A917RX39_9NOCA|nr:DUF2283 domain-containing protein [Nocardia jinanensis]GGL39906.1 hypothetical protein GCM10011588_63400 [Nocardia jinanensis]
MTGTPQHSFIGELTWDRRADAAYLAIASGEPGPRRAASTLPVENKDGELVAALDFASDGTLLGVELLDAATQLTAAMKSAAIDITDGRPAS